MKRTMSLGIGLLLPLTANASTSSGPDSYQSATRRISERNSQIDKVLSRYRSRLGLPHETGKPHSSFDSLVEEPESDSSHKRPSLIQVHQPWVRTFIPSGKLLYGQTLHRLVVSGEPAPCLVILDQDQGALSGVRLQGLATPSPTQGRLSIALSKVLFPSKAMPLSAVALDSDGALGLPAEVFSQKAWMVAGAMAGSFLSGLASAQTSFSSNALGLVQPNLTPRNAILQGVAQTGADQSKRLIEEATSEKPVLVLEAGKPITVFVNEEVSW